MYNTENTKGYEWEKPGMNAHDYITPSVKSKFKHLNIPNTVKILDAGCGGGYIANELYQQGYENIWGIDISKSGIEIAKNEFPHLRSRLAVHNVSHNNLPESFPQDGYDVILSVEVIEHLYSPQTYVRNIQGWLRKGGSLILTTPYHGYLKNLAIALINKSDRHYNPFNDEGHIKFFSKQGIFRLLMEVGIQPVSFSGSGRIPFLWKSMVVVGVND